MQGMVKDKQAVQNVVGETVAQTRSSVALYEELSEKLKECYKLFETYSSKGDVLKGRHFLKKHREGVIGQVYCRGS